MVCPYDIWNNVWATKLRSLYCEMLFADQTVSLDTVREHGEYEFFYQAKPGSKGRSNLIKCLLIG